MSNEIRSIASVENLLGHTFIDIYNEADLLQQNGTGGIDRIGVYGDGFLYEEYLSGEFTEGVTFGFCYNSYPFICRYIQRVNTDFFNVHHSWQRDRERYNRECPVCGRGVAAYLMLHCKHDERFGVRYYSYNGTETNQRTIFEAYLTICRKVYQAIRQDDYTHYKAVGDVEAINRLEAEFLSQHREAEEQNRNISGEVDRRFFGGQLASVVAAYLKYIGDVEAAAGGHQEAQEADKWVIDADVTLRVFGGDRAKAVAYLSAVVGHGLSTIEIGRETKRLKIDIPFRYGRPFWRMICANDTSQKEKGYSTFNKGRS